MSFTSLYIGSTGLKTQASAMSNLGNNIANVNTLAYKEKNMHFATLMSTAVPTGEPTGVSQKGMGAAVADVITDFTQGPLEPGNSFSDLAIQGKGFFMVKNSDGTFYTRAGNFRFDSQGYLVDPHGNRLQAQEILNGQTGSLGDLKLNTNGEGQFAMAGEATSKVTLGVNLGMQGEATADEDNPFFALLSSYQLSGDFPLPEESYGYMNSIKVYDENGKAHALNIFYDQVGVEDSKGYKHYEFVVALDRSNLSDAASAELAQPLLAGVLSFTNAGELANVAGYTLASGGSVQNLADWNLTQFSEDGGLAFSINLPGEDGAIVEQSLSLDFGLTNTSGAGTSGASTTAAEIGANPLNLPSFNGVPGDGIVTTALGGESGLIYSSQDGYSVGYLQNMTVSSDGVVTGIYSNGRSKDLYQIPLYYFTNPYGLQHEGSNLLSATPESGTALEGLPEDAAAGLGSIAENFLESSNVDLAREFVSMIITQRGFQANSKVITTTEQILQNAIQMKR